MPASRNSHDQTLARTRCQSFHILTHCALLLSQSIILDIAPSPIHTSLSFSQPKANRLPSMASDTAYNAATLNPTAQFEAAKAQCSLTPYLAYAEPYPNGWTLQHILLLAAGVGTILCLLASTTLIGTHLFNWVKPAEQKQIVRIILFAPIFALFNFFSLYAYHVSWVLLRFPELYECFALVAMFYLLVLYVAPNEGTRETFFHHLQRLGRYSHQPVHNRGSLQWFQTSWVLVFQILPAKLIISLVTWILNASMCPITYNVSHATTAISVIQSLTTIVCVMAIIGFHQRLKTELQDHHALAKLITFKGVVAIVLLQNPIFTGLAQHQAFTRTKYLSIVDFSVGIPAFMVCMEMFIVSLLFLWSFSAKEYTAIARSQQLKRGGVAHALINVVDIRDIIKGCWYMARIVLCGGMGKALDAPLAPTGQKDVEGYGDYAERLPSPPMAPAYDPRQQQQQQQQRWR